MADRATVVSSLAEVRPSLRGPIARLSTLRAKILLAFLLLGGITGFLGSYAVGSIAESGRLVVETYDKPLMAISYARAALADFAGMEATFARRRMTDDPDRRRELDRRIDELAQTMSDDLDVVAERSTSRRAARAVRDVRRAVAEWQSVRRQFLVGGVAQDLAWKTFDASAAAVDEQVDILVNLAAGDGFLGRQRALAAVEANRRLAVAGTLIALALSALVTAVLTRRLLGPVRAASNAAGRIAQGELDTTIPSAGADELGALLAAMSVMRDNIRAMMEREIAQRRSAQARLVDAVESSQEAVVLVDGSGRIVVANSQTADFFPGVTDLLAPGTSYAEIVIGLLDRSAFAGASPEEEAARRRRLQSCGLPVASEEQLADGRWLRISRSETSEGGFVAFCSDITALKERESALRAAKDQAEAASRAKTEFLTNMSHELRTPLNAIIGFSEMIAGQTFGPVGNPQYQEFAKDILSSGRHLLAVINDILALTRGDAGKLTIKPKPIDIGKMFEECRTLVQDQCARTGLTLEVVPPAELVRIEADPVKVRQVLLNLLSNAIKFTPAEGRVRLALTAQDKETVTLEVADTGIGMRPEDIPVALSPFGQVDSSLARQYEGTGLGLPLTKTLVELHGGHLTIDSAPGQGTVVMVVLPIEQPEDW